MLNPDSDGKAGSFQGPGFVFIPEREIVTSAHSIPDATDRHTVSLMVVVGVYSAVIMKHAPESCKMGKISRSSPPASDIAHVEEGSGTIKTIAEAARPG